ncbi:MAG: 6-phosphofructokinase [Saprospiraceae bacterium]|nr:6-phosphofructokinase [Saprospiraceae bacterium]
MQQKDFDIEKLGPCKIMSPLQSKKGTDKFFHFVEDSERVLFDVIQKEDSKNGVKAAKPLTMELAGPRQHIYFDPSKTTVAIVTCGGLCPGINDVIRSLVLAFWYRYGVTKILGVQYGYQGFIPDAGHPFIELTPKRKPT